MDGLRFGFRAVGRHDFPLLALWMAAPHVRTWWREEVEPDAIEERYGPAVDGTEATELFLVMHDEEAIGFIQRYRLEDNPEWQRSLSVAGGPANGAGIDYFIGSEALIGHGYGPAIIDQFTNDTWGRYPEIAAIVVNVSPDNRRSWRALEKVGFERIWTGTIESDDPSDAGLNHVYLRRRPAPPSTGPGTDADSY
jgi:aminoglycoside 6'-N-acetyltransferase